MNSYTLNKKVFSLFLYVVSVMSGARSAAGRRRVCLRGCLQCFDTDGWWQEGHPACRNRVLVVWWWWYCRHIHHLFVLVVIVYSRLGSLCHPWAASADASSPPVSRLRPTTIVRANVRNVLFVSNRTCVQNAFDIFPNVKRTC